MRARQTHFLRANNTPHILLDSIVVSLTTNNHPVESRRDNIASGTLEHACKLKHLFDSRLGGPCAPRLRWICLVWNRDSFS
jgi:hypothetical protein